MAIPDLTITEDYAALNILTQSQLNDAMTSIQDYINTDVKPNFEQIGADVFGTYEFNNDGLPSLPTPLIDLVAQLDGDETITGSYTFENTVAFQNTVTMQGVVNMTGMYKAKAYRATTVLAVANTTVTPVTLNAEVYDTGDMHNDSTNSERITIPADGTGVYAFSAQVSFAANVTGRREAYIYKNGVQFAKAVENTNSATISTYLVLNAQDSASGGDYYDLRVYQSSGGSLDINFGVSETFFSAVKVT